MNKKILIIIDAQYDFINGSLAVDGSEDKMVALSKFIKERANEYSTIILSADFHPISHCSFKKNGGMWPIHCVQHTHGAAIYQPIIDALEESNIDFHIFTKGLDEDHEEYSVLKNNDSNKKIHALIEHIGANEVDFCGIADIYCVKDSIEHFHRDFTNIKINVLIDFIGFMDEKKFYDFLSKNDYNVKMHMVY